jgi:hypothetical protein
VLQRRIAAKDMPMIPRSLVSLASYSEEGHKEGNKRQKRLKRNPFVTSTSCQLSLLRRRFPMSKGFAPQNPMTFEGSIK